MNVPIVKSPAATTPVVLARIKVQRREVKTNSVRETR